MERGYGLYGKENYQYPPTTMDPVKTGARVGGEKFVSMEEIRNEMRNGNGNTNGYVSKKQGMSDTRFLENGKYYYDINQDAKDQNGYTENGYESEKMGVSEDVEDENSYSGNNGNGSGNGTGNEFVTEKQGMSDTRFLENGRYHYDINQDVKDENRYTGNGYATEKQGMSEHEEDENSYNENEGNGYRYGDGYVTEKQGMSDLENRRYHFGINQDVKNEDTYLKNRRNGNGYVTEKQGMSDTRFLENGKYFHDINAETGKGGTGYANEYNNGNENFEEEMNGNYEKSNNHYNNNNYENKGFLNDKNVYDNGYNENEHYEGDNGHETEGRGHNYNPNEYVTQGGENYHGNTKNLPPNQYDTMEEYEKEEEYRLSHQYIP